MPYDSRDAWDRANDLLERYLLARFRSNPAIWSSPDEAVRHLAACHYATVGLPGTSEERICDTGCIEFQVRAMVSCGCSPEGSGYFHTFTDSHIGGLTELVAALEPYRDDAHTATLSPKRGQGDSR